MDEISLVNHASIYIKNDEISLLSDPWFSGLAFNKGWALLYENDPIDIKNLVSELTHIYISHEHPDHFSIEFFRTYENILKERDVKIIVQKTRDNRVFNFLNKKLMLNVIAISDDWTSLSPTVKCKIKKCGAIDSALIIETEQNTFLNMNDCDFSFLELHQIKKSINKNKPKILFYQFSYAAWRASEYWLEKAAKYKINNLEMAAKLLDTQITIPFASYSYFCHEQNFQLNKAVNKPADVVRFAKERGLECVFLPLWPQVFSCEKLLSDSNLREVATTNAIAFWASFYRDLHETQVSENPAALPDEDEFNEFLMRIKQSNNLMLMKLINLLTFNKIFSETVILVSDQAVSYSIGYRMIRKLDCPNECDISMDSEMFKFMIKQPFGVDTVSINGRFKECKVNGFQRFVFALGFQTLNASGYGVRFRDLFVGTIIFRLLIIPIRLIKKNS